MRLSLTRNTIMGLMNWHICDGFLAPFSPSNDDHTWSCRQIWTIWIYHVCWFALSRNPLMWWYVLFPFRLVMFSVTLPMVKYDIIAIFVNYGASVLVFICSWSGFMPYILKLKRAASFSLLTKHCSAALVKCFILFWN